MSSRWLSSVKECIARVGIVWPPPPLLPVANPPPAALTLHPIIQILQNLDLGKLLLTLAASSTLGLLFSLKFDSASIPQQFIISALMAAFMILWNGILLRTMFPHIGSMIEVVGINLVLLSFFGLINNFLSGGFSLVCWLSGAFCMIPSIFLVIKPQAAA